MGGQRDSHVDAGRLLEVLRPYVEDVEVPRLAIRGAKGGTEVVAVVPT